VLQLRTEQFGFQLPESRRHGNKPLTELYESFELHIGETSIDEMRAKEAHVIAVKRQRPDVTEIKNAPQLPRDKSILDSLTRCRV